jgi:multiple antibiotic resistance protein
MNDTLQFAMNSGFKLFIIFCPFMTVSLFLGITRDFDRARRKAFAMKAMFTIATLCLFFYFFGSFIFAIFGITLDAFRIGAGALLFLTAVEMVKGSPNAPSQSNGEEDDVQQVVVPFSFPIIVGPAVIGVLFVMGADVTTMTPKIAGTLMTPKIAGAVAVLVACFVMGFLLLIATEVERWMGKSKLAVFSKITGIILAALASQMIFTGIKAFLG